jgi:hypothetical protein
MEMISRCSLRMLMIVPVPIRHHQSGEHRLSSGGLLSHLDPEPSDVRLPIRVGTESIRNPIRGRPGVIIIPDPSPARPPGIPSRIDRRPAE